MKTSSTSVDEGILEEMFNIFDGLLKGYYAAQQEYYIASEQFKRDPQEQTFLAQQSTALSLIFSRQKMEQGQGLLDKANGKVYGEMHDEDLGLLLGELKGVANVR